jgi:hypothetical protein
MDAHTDTRKPNRQRALSLSPALFVLGLAHPPRTKTPQTLDQRPQGGVALCGWRLKLSREIPSPSGGIPEQYAGAEVPQCRPLMNIAVNKSKRLVVERGQSIHTFVPGSSYK